MSATQSGSGERLIFFAGEQYDIMDDTVEIPEAEVPPQTEMIRQDEGPSNSVVMQTRRNVYIRTADGRVSQLKIKGGVDLEALRKKHPTLLSDPETYEKKKVNKDSVAAVSKRLERFTERCNDQFDKTAGKLANIRELLQACLDGIATKTNPQQNESTSQNGSAEDKADDDDKANEDEKAGDGTEEDDDYVSVSEAERDRQRRRRKKKSPGLNFTSASASTKVNETAKQTAKMTGKRCPTIRDEGDPSSSSSADESDARDASPISSIRTNKSRADKNRTTTFEIPLSTFEKSNPAIKDVPRRNTRRKESESRARKETDRTRKDNDRARKNDDRERREDDRQR